MTGCENVNKRVAPTHRRRRSFRERDGTEQCGSIEVLGGRGIFSLAKVIGLEPMRT
jgi:hypothetical protein